MGHIPKIIPISDLRKDAAAVLRKIRVGKHPLFITQRGRAAAVLMSIDAYETAEKEREVLRILAQGEREIATGKGFSLSNVMAEADAILEEE